MKEYEVECIRCGAHYTKEDVVYTCRKCDGLLNIKYDYSEIDPKQVVNAKGEGVWKYRTLLPFSNETEQVTINEGNTPCIDATDSLNRLASEIYG